MKVNEWEEIGRMREIAPLEHYQLFCGCRSVGGCIGRNCYCALGIRFMKKASAPEWLADLVYSSMFAKADTDDAVIHVVWTDGVNSYRMDNENPCELSSDGFHLIRTTMDHSRIVQYGEKDLNVLSSRNCWSLYRDAVLRLP
jgi:hypothetical protein